MDTLKIEAAAIRLKCAEDALTLLAERLEDECTPSGDTQAELATMGICISARKDMFTALITLVRDSIGKQAEDLMAALRP